MNQNEFDMIIDRFLDGAARVRAKKYESNLTSKNVHRQLSSRIISQMWNKENTDCNAA
ncbi:hypothetical protein [Prochlorococcus marinus]|uniref:hypothetical protein n=1 Tax=Prochlorococcus marinus TaxID=1219 RepID=UPI0022B39EE1|nr:hypothetical protein [Prochlorococcus marinus]